METFGQVIPVTGALSGFPGNRSRLTADDIVSSRPVSPTTATNLPFGSGAVLVSNSTGGYWQSLADYLGTATNAANLLATFAGVAVRNIKTQQPYSAYAQTSVTSVSTTATQGTVGATTIVVASATGISAGQSVEGAGIAPNTLVVSISSTTVTISLGTTAALSTTSVAFINNVSGAAVGSFGPGTQGEVLERGSISVLVAAGTPAAGGAVYVRTVANVNISGTAVGDFEAAADNLGSPPNVTTTVGSTSVTVSSATGLAVGQVLSGYMFAGNTFITAISGTTLTISVAAVAAVSAVACVVSNTALLGTNPTDPWVVFRTGTIDTNNVSEITIKSRRAA